MRPSISSQHINPIQGKLPLQPHNGKEVSRASNVSKDKSHQSSQSQIQNNVRRQSSAQRRQNIQMVVQQPVIKQLMRTVESGQGSEQSVRSSFLQRSRSPSKGSFIMKQGCPQLVQVIHPLQPSQPLPQQTTQPVPQPKPEAQKKILQLNIQAMQQRDQLRQTEIEQLKKFESSGLTRSSLEQLYEELSELRNKVSNFKEKEKKLAEVEAQTVEKEKTIKDQLNRQKLLFEDYETRIKALHISIENYERRQKELLSTVARKEAEQEKLHTVCNRLKVEVAQANLKVNIAESKHRKLSQQQQEDASAILGKLGYTIPPQCPDPMRFAIEQFTQYHSSTQHLSSDYQTLQAKHFALTSKTSELEAQHAGLQARHSTLEQLIKKKDDELARAKQKVTELVSTFYAEISKLGAEVMQLKVSLRKAESEKEEKERELEEERTRMEERVKGQGRVLEGVKREKDELAEKVEEIGQKNTTLSKQLNLVRNSLRVGQCNCAYVRKIIEQSKPEDATPQGPNVKLQQLLDSIFQTLTP